MIVYAEPSAQRSDIAAAELGALFESTGVNVHPLGDGPIVTCEVKELPDSIGARAAFLKEVGVLLWAGDSGEILGQARTLDTSLFVGSDFKVDAEGFGSSQKKEVDELFAGRVMSTAEGAAVSLKNPGRVLKVARRGKTGFVGVSSPKGKGKWVARRPRARAFFHPSALFPKLARLMVNLSALPEGGTFLDPFSGTCSTVIEASLLGAYSVGLDVDKKMVFGGRRNLRGFGLDLGSQVIHGDVRFLPFRRFDAIAGDVPYGRASSTKGSKSNDLLDSMLHQGLACLRRNGRLVVMHAKGTPVKRPKGFEAVGEYEFYVHRSLTRVISVLRKS